VLANLEGATAVAPAATDIMAAAAAAAEFATLLLHFPSITPVRTRPAAVTGQQPGTARYVAVVPLPTPVVQFQGLAAGYASETTPRYGAAVTLS
jgi:hypothetical protein